MKHEYRIATVFKREFADWSRWWARAVVIAFAAAAGLTVVGFNWLTEHALRLFFDLRAAWWWAPLGWIPASTPGIVWLTRRFAVEAAGSGIPQVMAALEPSVDASQHGLLVSIRLTLAKIVLTTWGLLAGLSLRREGPSVQIAAGIMLAERRWLPQRS